MTMMRIQGEKEAARFCLSVETENETISAYCIYPHLDGSSFVGDDFPLVTTLKVAII